LDSAVHCLFTHVACLAVRNVEADGLWTRSPGRAGPVPGVLDWSVPRRPANQLYRSHVVKRVLVGRRCSAELYGTVRAWTPRSDDCLRFIHHAAAHSHTD